MLQGDPPLLSRHGGLAYKRLVCSGACEWLGNSAPIADKHYLQVTDEHYNNAITSPPGQGDAKSDAQVAQRIEKVAQNAAQQVTATGGTNSQETKEARENRAVLQPLAAGCETLPSSQVPPRGVELFRYFSGYSANSSELSADVSADSLNPEQLAAMLRDLDRSELEQLLLTLLSKAESASE